MVPDHQNKVYVISVYTIIKCIYNNKESACNAGDLVQFLAWEDTLEKG